MIKKLAWNVFKSTGDVNTFLELKQIENLERQNTYNIINDAFNQNNINKAVNMEKNSAKGETKWE